VFTGNTFLERDIVQQGHIQSDQKVSVHMTSTAQSSGAQRLFDHPVDLYVTGATAG